MRRLIVIFFSCLMVLTGCVEINKKESFDIRSITTYKDIPGITDEEIHAIEELKKTRESFNFGQLYGVESFINIDGSYEGFAVRHSDLFGDLFGIEFNLQLYDEWSTMKADLDNFELDFSGDFAPTSERILRYYMTSPIAERSLRVFTYGDNVFEAETDLNELNVGFLRGTITVDFIKERYPNLDFEVINLDTYGEVVEKLRKGEIDVFILDGVVAPFLEKYDSIYSKEFFNLVYTPVSLTTANPELAPIISVIDKFLVAGGIDIMYELYQLGNQDYIEDRIWRSFTDTEKEYIYNLRENKQPVKMALERHNYPISFYNIEEKEFQGMALDIIDKIKQFTGIEFELDDDESATRASIVSKLREGDVSVVAYLLNIEERGEDFFWSYSYDRVNCVLISKVDYPALEIYQVPSRVVGVLKGSAFEDLYYRWFLKSGKVKKYDTRDEVINALEAGEIDLYLTSEYTLLSLLNFKEKSGFKENIRFDVYVDTSFGFNTEEEILRSIFNKTLQYINTRDISNEWKSHSFDYLRELAEVRTKYFAIFSGVLGCSLLGVVFLFYKNLRLSKGLEGEVQKRTGELEKQTHILKETMGELKIYNEMLMIPQTAANTADAVNVAVGKLRDSCGCEKVLIVQKNEYSELMDIVMSCPSVDYTYSINDDIIKSVKSSELICFGDVGYELFSVLGTVYTFGFKVLDGFIILIFAQKKKKLDEKEKKIIIELAYFLESMLSRKSTEDDRVSFAERLERKVNERTEELRLMTIEAGEAQQKAQEASKAKSLFLANMSHEIRTPMNSILGMIELLMSEELDDRKFNYVKEIKSSATLLLGIINDILDLSKINEGKFSIIPVDTDFNLLLKNVISMIKSLAQAKGLKFIDDLQIKDNEYVYIDEIRVKQVLLNILSNAVKFTDKGEIKFSVKIDDHIRFEVRDTGVGIRQGEVDLIFNAFEQVDKYRNRTIQGTGLGLAVAKRLVDSMGGDIKVTSEYGAGTAFYVNIPYKQGSKPFVQFEDTPESFKAPTAQVLMVDDIQTNLTVGAGLLRLYGIICDVAKSGVKALELLGYKDYDLVFMDHMMPEEDGIVVTQKIRNLGENYEKLPIIALTANAYSETRDLLLNSGMDDFLSKPIDRKELESILKKWLPESKIEESSDKSIKADVILSDTLIKLTEIDGLNIEVALSRLENMQDVLEKAVRNFSHSVDSHVLQMKESLDKKDLGRFAIEVHGLKSSLANIGALEYSFFAAELELAADAGNIFECNEKFDKFLIVIESFANALKAIFSDEQVLDKELGERDLLGGQVKEVINYLTSFESDEAVLSLNELLKCTFGNEIDNLLQGAASAVGKYDYNQALRSLNNLLILLGNS